MSTLVPGTVTPDAGIAISDGAEIARQIADITIGSEDLESIVTLREISTLLMKRIRFNYRTMQGLVKKLRDMGYSEVRLIDTTNGMFMSKWESTWMGLSGSAILTGRK